MSFFTIIKSLFKNGLFLSFIGGCVVSGFATMLFLNNTHLKEKNELLSSSNQALTKKADELKKKDEKIKELIKNTEILEDNYKKKEVELSKVKASFKDPISVEVEKVIYKQCEIPKSGALLIQNRITQSNNLKNK